MQKILASSWTRNLVPILQTNLFPLPCLSPLKTTDLDTQINCFFWLAEMHVYFPRYLPPAYVKLLRVLSVMSAQPNLQAWLYPGSSSTLCQRLLDGDAYRLFSLFDGLH